MALFQAQLRSIARNACALTNGQASVSWYDDDLLRFRLRIRPNYGIYQGSWYEFTVRASDNYPTSSPIIISCTYILHPNINEYGEVMNRALSPWQRGYDLKHVMVSLLNMFHHPDFTNISNIELEDLSEVEFIRKVSAWSRGYVSKSRPYNSERTNRHTDSSTNLLLSTYELYQDFPESPPAHHDHHCQCNNSFVFVTNSKRPLSGNRNRRRMFSEAYQQSGYYQNVQIHSASTSMIDLSDIHESIRGIEPDYEIRSISSDDEPDMEYTPSPPPQATGRQTSTCRTAMGCNIQDMEYTPQGHATGPQTIGRCTLTQLSPPHEGNNRNLYNKPLMDKDVGMNFLL